jgi:hypothetical protein
LFPIHCNRLAFRAGILIFIFQPLSWKKEKPMLHLSVLLFALAAAGGLVLASMHFRGKDRPWTLAVIHGLLAASGLVLLAAAVLGGAAPDQAQLSFGLFFLAALGGFLLFAFHLQKRRLPSAVVLIHGGVAAVAFLILVAALYVRG